MTLWPPRLAEIPAVALAAVAIVAQILRYSKLWTAPVDPVDQAVLLVALLVVSFFALRQRIEHLERSVEETQTGELFFPIRGRQDIYEASARLIVDSPVPENEREILLTTIISPRGIESDQVIKQRRYNRCMDTALVQRIQDGWAVRRLVVVRNKKELDFVVAQYVYRFDDQRKSNYEVRVFAKPDTLPPVPLLVVGRERALIGLYGEGAGGAMKGAFVFHGDEPAALARRHFLTLWDWADSQRLRPHDTNELDKATYDRICQELGVIDVSKEG